MAGGAALAGGRSTVFSGEAISGVHGLGRSGGTGTALLQVAKASSSRLRLWTFQRNRAARRFYEARGFVLIEETDGAANHEKEPDALYRWTR
jgi:GNAT superfamily N-acetyltransferase